MEWSSSPALVCVDTAREQVLANLLYERMDTGKWYPTVSYLADALKVEGFRLDDIRPAAATSPRSFTKPGTASSPTSNTWS